MPRYHRQTLLPWVGDAGQAAIARGRVLLVGCGALGTVVAEYLTRAGVGLLRIVDRDIVELTNLQRQTLFSEQDAEMGMPKAPAAAARLREINTSITVEPMTVDVDRQNIQNLSADVDVIVDATDNAPTRYLINDVSLSQKTPWIYGACVGMTGRMMTVLPHQTPCLRCLFPSAPGPGELATCDTSGVLGPLAGVVASLQAADALKVLTGRSELVARQILAVDLMTGRFHGTSTESGGRTDCPACSGQYDYLHSTAQPDETLLCGRNTVQIRAPRGAAVDLSDIAQKLRVAGSVEQTPYLVRCRLTDAALALTVFPDGRVLIQGTSDLARARSIHARYFGS